MSNFESGTMSFRAFYLEESLPADVVDRFARLAAPSIEHLGDAELHGWVTGRHLLDRNITEDTATYGGYLRLTLMHAERKIPDSLYKAECAIEEQAQMAAMGLDFLPRKIKMEVRKQVRDRLKPEMPPTLKGIHMVYDENNSVLYAGCMTDKQYDAFVLNFKEATGVMPRPITPWVAALRLLKLDVTHLPVVSFSPDCDADEVNDSIGQDFLTWLWFFSETRGGTLEIDDSDRFAVMVDGPLSFSAEGAGAHDVALKNGNPLQSAEAKAALVAGKKLKRAKVVLARGDEMWSVTLDADDFGFRSLKFPEAEKLDAVSAFQQRMIALDTFLGAFLELYKLFLREREDSTKWASTTVQLHEWIENRHARS